MILKKVGVVLFLVLFIFPIYKIFAQDTNAGFISGNIWYSKDPFEEGDKIKIYTFIFNPDMRELSGTVIFFDKTVLLGKKNFVIPPKKASDIYIDWIVTAGDHTIFGKIENAKFLISKGEYEEVYLIENETEKSLRTISKKIVLEPVDKNVGSTYVQDIKKIIEEEIPDFITKPIVSTTDKLEEFRENINITSENKKEEIKNEIEVLNSKKSISSLETKTNPFLKPFKYVELFFLSIFFFIFNNKILFYGLIVIIIFFIFRFIWKKLF